MASEALIDMSLEEVIKTDWHKKSKAGGHAISKRKKGARGGARGARRRELDSWGNMFSRPSFSTGGDVRRFASGARGVLTKFEKPSSRSAWDSPEQSFGKGAGRRRRGRGSVSYHGGGRYSEGAGGDWGFGGGSFNKGFFHDDRDLDDFPPNRFSGKGAFGGRSYDNEFDDPFASFGSRRKGGKRGGGKGWGDDFGDFGWSRRSRGASKGKGKGKGIPFGTAFGGGTWFGDPFNGGSTKAQDQAWVAEWNARRVSRLGGIDKLAGGRSRAGSRFGSNMVMVGGMPISTSRDSDWDGSAATRRFGMRDSGFRSNGRGEDFGGTRGRDHRNGGLDQVERPRGSMRGASTNGLGYGGGGRAAAAAALANNDASGREITSEDRKMMKKIKVVAELDKVPAAPKAMVGASKRDVRGSRREKIDGVGGGNLSSIFGANFDR